MPHTLAPGAHIGGYRIDSLLGVGATGSVYLARDVEGSAVALKVLEPTMGADARFRERFLRESGVAALLEHPSVVPVLDAGEDDGLLFLAMEWVDGSDLRARLRRDGPLEPARAVALVEEIAAGLDVAHAAGLVHRDVKPGNILVAGDHARLCDFGLAKHTARAESLTGERMLVGTVAYIAPEQIEGAGVDARSDVYSLGCVLYECLTGEPPFDRDTELAVLYAHLNEPPPRPSSRRPGLPPALDDVIAAALAKSPADRPRSCGELARSARAALRGESPRRRGRRRGARRSRHGGGDGGARGGRRGPGRRSGRRAGRSSAQPRAERARRDRRERRPAGEPRRAARPAGRRGGGRAVGVGRARRPPARGQGGRPPPSRRVVGRAAVRRWRHRAGRRCALGVGGGGATDRTDRPQRARGPHAPGRPGRTSTPARWRWGSARSGSAAGPRCCACIPAPDACWHACRRRSR